MEIEKIHSILKPHLKGQTVTDDTALISGGLIDSMSIADLIVDLEAAFGIRIPASEVEPDDFDTPRRILSTLERFR